MEKSGNIMLPEHISQPDDLHLWTFYRKSKRTPAGVCIEEWVCPMRHVLGCFAGIRLVTGHGFEQLERCGHHDKDSHVRRLMSARKSFFPSCETDDEDDDDSEDECPEEDEDSEQEDEGPEELWPTMSHRW